MSRPFQQHGLTLLELMIALTITVIIVNSIVSSWAFMMETVTASQTKTGIRNAFGTARESAVYYNQVVTLCPLNAKNKCVSDWNKPVSIFLDPSSQKVLSDPGNLLKVVQIHDSGKLSSSSVGGGNYRRYFQYNPNGSMRGSIGHLVWCPTSGRPNGAIQVRLNFGGRILWAKDHDGDGIVEGSSGQPIECKKH